MKEQLLARLESFVNIIESGSDYPEEEFVELMGDIISMVNNADLSIPNTPAKPNFAGTDKLKLENERLNNYVNDYICIIKYMNIIMSYMVEKMKNYNLASKLYDCLSFFMKDYGGVVDTCRNMRINNHEKKVTDEQLIELLMELNGNYKSKNDRNIKIRQLLLERYNIDFSVKSIDNRLKELRL